MPRLYGERVILREYRKNDLEDMLKWTNNPNVTKYLSDIFLYAHSKENTEKFLDSMLQGISDSKGFVIAEKSTEKYLGQIDIINIDWKNRSAMIGIVIGSEENMSKGYGSEAIKLIQKFAFYTLNLNRLWLTLHSYNERAHRCYMNCGFIEEGRERSNFFYEGQYTDTVIMSILREEYKKTTDKDGFYDILLKQAKALVDDEPDIIANMANISALLYNNMDKLNWAGFYMYKDQQLVLGPFQGKPACIRIPIGKGVCGTAVSERGTQIVANVHQFPGHIACDSASNSEIVVPLIKNDDVYGVLDIDSPYYDRFDKKDAQYLEKLVEILVSNF